MNEILKELISLEEKELYLRLKKWALMFFKEAIEKDDANGMKEYKKLLENLEIAYRTHKIVDCFYEEENSFDEELKEEINRLEEETAKEKHNEFIPERKLKKGEVDVNTLPL